MPKKKAAEAVSHDDTSGMSRLEPTRPVTPGQEISQKTAAIPGNAQPANRKSERMARRELLYVVVRGSMMRAGVLSASYKFKVLSLDARGRQFLVMVDLARGHGGETGRLAEIEAVIAQNAKSRYDIMVMAVYWRMNEHVAVGLPSTRPFRAMPMQSQPQSLSPLPDSLLMALDAKPASEVGTMPAALEGRGDTAPANLAPQETQTAPAPLPSPPLSQPPRSPSPAAERSMSRYEPIGADEVAAFRQALVAGTTRPASTVTATAATATVPPSRAKAKSFDGSSKHGPQSYTLLTGFEDTELPDLDSRLPALSGTQYGDLN